MFSKVKVGEKLRDQSLIVGKMYRDSYSQLEESKELKMIVEKKEQDIEKEKHELKHQLTKLARDQQDIARMNVDLRRKHNDVVNMQVSKTFQFCCKQKRSGLGDLSVNENFDSVKQK